LPELPEVETTRRGLSPFIKDQKILSCTVFNKILRYPVTPGLEACLAEAPILDLKRRGKYLLFETPDGHMMVHLGMSGSMRLVEQGFPREKHDHVEWQLSNGLTLRYRDPRRFGLVIWIENDPMSHPLLAKLGPEPLEDGFSSDYLYNRLRGRKAPIKNLIMNSQVVVGVGNIYANEALFLSGIRPLRAASRISRHRYGALVTTIKTVLSRAIQQGGTTLRDFVGGDGNPGYFSQSLSVYGRQGQPCVRCGGPLKEVRLLQRTTVYCPRCQQ
jgi:formamidopyrimidine-DNA glycosylase